jgi:hypothetical protein
MHYAIYYISNNLTQVEHYYKVNEKEFPAIVCAINKSHYYIIGYLLFIHIDNSSINYLWSKLVTNCKVNICLLFLQEFNITILNKFGWENVVVDFLSRLTNEGEFFPVEDTFPNEHLFSFSINKY